MNHHEFEVNDDLSTKPVIKVQPQTRVGKWSVILVLVVGCFGVGPDLKAWLSDRVADIRHGGLLAEIALERSDPQQLEAGDYRFDSGTKFRFFLKRRTPQNLYAAIVHVDENVEGILRTSVADETESLPIRLDERTGTEHFFLLLSRDPVKQPDMTAAEFQNWLGEEKSSGAIRYAHMESGGSWRGIRGSLDQGVLVAEIDVFHH